jgi:hypothetical protein
MYIKKNKRRSIKKVVHISHSFAEAEQWEIQQEITMTAPQRMAAARKIQEWVYGKKTKDIRAWHRDK